MIVYHVCCCVVVLICSSEHGCGRPGVVRQVEAVRVELLAAHDVAVPGYSLQGGAVGGRCSGWGWYYIVKQPII